MTQYSGVYTLQTQGQALTSGQWATDPYYKNTTLLLHADGVAGGAQNNTFLDSSTNAFAITRNGNTTQGSFTPYGPTWSNYFPSGSMLSTAYSSGFDFGTGDFTMEAWVKLDSLPAPQTIFSCVDAGATVGYSLLILANGFVEVDVVAAQSFICNSNAVVAGTWTHIAFTKSSGTYRAFVNGSLCTTSSNTLGTTINSTPQGMCVGRSVATGYNFPLAGYISNARIVKGTALYTSSFTPSTTPLTTVTGTSLLTCQSNSFKDIGFNYLPLTVTGTPSVQRFSPFAPQYQYTPAVIGGSGYFDGTSDYLTTDALVTVGTTDFTYESWVYITATSYELFYQPIANGPYITFNAAGSTWGIGQALGSINNNFGAAPTQNQWHYIAVSRSGSTINAYIDGTRVYTGSNSVNYAGGTGLRIGQGITGTYTGYTSDMRISFNYARYTSSTMTVPTTPVASDANTYLLLNMTNAGIYDNAMMNDLETVGNAQVSTSVVKYGSGSLAFDGSGDYLSTLPQSGQFGTGDFTVEAWVNTSSTSTESIASLNNYNSNGWALGVNFPSAGNFFWYSNSAAIVSSSGAVLNTWVHVAVVRASGVLSLFVNGVLRSTAANTTNYSASSSLLVGNDMSSQYFTGYIDDLRITKGVARYTGNFIPPQVAFANQ